MTSLPIVAVASVLVSLGLMLSGQLGSASAVGLYGDSTDQSTAVRPASGAAVQAGRPRAAAGPRMVLADAEPLAVQGPPTIDVATVRRVLRQYNSPATGEAEAFVELGRRYGIDPAICLAFFIMESSAGTRGVATETRSVGNIRATPGYVNYKGYRRYATWRDGIDDWYRLIARVYVDQWRLTTVEAIVPVYAPAADNNDPAHYTATVRRLVDEWRARQ
jgi:hypothetical protein